MKQKHKDILLGVYNSDNPIEALKKIEWKTLEEIRQEAFWEAVSGYFEYELGKIGEKALANRWHDYYCIKEIEEMKLCGGGIIPPNNPDPAVPDDLQKYEHLNLED